MGTDRSTLGTMFEFPGVVAFVAAFVVASYASPTQGILDGLLQRGSSIRSECGHRGPASCTNTTVVPDKCCFEYPGGLILLTQFWDFDPPTGPSDSWTIHGLWPDNCDGTFSENCDPSRDYANISSLLISQGAYETLSLMETYWVNINGNNTEFWEHEWAKHGTCYNTLKPSCLPPGSPPGAEAVAFFETVVGLFKVFDIYWALEAADITPSTTVNYTLASLQNAFIEVYSFTPAFYCDSGSLNQVYFYFHLKGSVIDGEFLPIDAPYPGNCPPSEIRYPPKIESYDK